MWVEALRSGQYKKGTGRLRPTYDSFCCLGVLCNLHAMEHPSIAAIQEDPHLYMNESVGLPRAVQVWAGLDGFFGGSVVLYGRLEGLDYWNDRGVDFKTLADAIEKQL